MKLAPIPAPILDRVVIVTSGHPQVLTVAQFFALPLSQRIRAMIDRSATFYCGEREIDRQAALDAIRVLRATG